AHRHARARPRDAARSRDQAPRQRRARGERGAQARPGSVAHHALRQSGDGRGFARPPHLARLSRVAARRSGASRGGELLVSAREDPAELVADILERAAARGRAEGVPYAGLVTPAEAWTLQQARAAAIVDVRPR